MAFDQGYADALAEAATLRQELAASEAACASAMAEVEALRHVEAKLGQAQAELCQRLAVACEQRDTWRTMHHEVEAERDALRTAVAHIVAMVDHGTALAQIMHAVVQLRRFVDPEVTS